MTASNHPRIGREDACRRHGLSVLENDVLSAFGILRGGVSPRFLKDYVANHLLCVDDKRETEGQLIDSAVERLLSGGHLIAVTAEIQREVHARAGSSWGPCHQLGSVGDLNVTESGMMLHWSVGRESGLPQWAEVCWIETRRSTDGVFSGLAIARTVEDLDEGLRRRFVTRFARHGATIAYRSPVFPVPAWRDFWWRPIRSGQGLLFSLSENVCE